MLHKRVPLVATLAIVVAVLAAGSDGAKTALAVGGGSFRHPDTTGAIGEYASVVLDFSGNPVVAYYDKSNGNLKLLHCDDPNCAGNESGNIVTPDESVHDAGYVQGLGLYPSLRLDGSGNPVIAYHDHDHGKLKILHCDDPKCAGNEIPNTSVPDTGPDSLGDPGHNHAGSWLSLVLDASGQPVVSYRDGVVNPGNDGNLRVMHCNDVNCSGYNESIVTISDSGHDVANNETSIALDAGNPVVSYVDNTVGELKLLHCDDADCAGDESAHIHTLDIIGANGFPSLVLDSNSFPVISYGKSDGGELRLIRCNDEQCDNGGDTSVVLDPYIAPNNRGGYYTSVVLDDDVPVVTENDVGVKEVRMVRCGDPSCVTKTKTLVDWWPGSIRGIGYPSLAIDSSHNPVIVYARSVPGDLWVAHCGNVSCGPDSDGDHCPDAEEAQTAVGSQMSGGLRDYLNPWDYFNPTHDGRNRVDDILAVVQQYFQDQYYPSPPYPPNTPNPLYTTDTDRTQATPYQWSLGPPSGAQRVDDILAAVHQYFHDCS